MQQPNYEPPQVIPTSVDCGRRRMCHPIHQRHYSQSPLHSTGSWWNLGPTHRFEHDPSEGHCGNRHIIRPEGHRQCQGPCPWSKCTYWGSVEHRLRQGLHMWKGQLWREPRGCYHLPQQGLPAGPTTLGVPLVPPDHTRNAPDQSQNCPEPSQETFFEGHPQCHDHYWDQWV